MDQPPVIEMRSICSIPPVSSLDNRPPPSWNRTVIFTLTLTYEYAGFPALNPGIHDCHVLLDIHREAGQHSFLNDLFGTRFREEIFDAPSFDGYDIEFLNQRFMTFVSGVPQEITATVFPIATTTEGSGMLTKKIQWAKIFRDG